jgi:hypothetical protein
MLSVDIVNDPKLGDLSREDTIALWMNLLEARAVVGFAAGPPCESFAAVRHVPVAADKHGPPPLRSLEHMWGLPYLSKKQGRQVIIGNILYRTCILLAAKARQVGAFALIEHPREADWLPEHPSSWKLPQTAKLLSMNYADSVAIDQCTCGTSYKKPTRLMYVNLPGLPRHIAQLPGGGKCFHSKHSVTLVGKDMNGRFRTAPAKEYPQPFCQVIALAMHDFVKEFTGAAPFDVEVDNQIARTLAPFYTPLDPYLSTHTVGAYGADFVDAKPSKCKARRLADKDLYKVNFLYDEHGNPVPDTESGSQLNSSQVDCGTASSHDDVSPAANDELPISENTAAVSNNLTAVQKERIAFNRQQASSRKKDRARQLALSLIRGCALRHVCDDHHFGATESPTTPFFLPFPIGRGATIHSKFKIPKRT